jgi:hypothetical protein
MPHPPRSQRLYRRCPSCQVVRPASEFRRAGGLTFARSEAQRRRCPACGFVGPLVGFQVVERPAEADEGAPS